MALQFFNFNLIVVLFKFQRLKETRFQKKRQVALKVKELDKDRVKRG